MEKAKAADLKFAESRGMSASGRNGDNPNAAGARRDKRDKFNYEQRNWDFEELERLKREELRRNLEE